jgi:SAM-dependent methyltransferase
MGIVERTDVASRLLPVAMRAYRRVVGWAFTRLYREFAWTYDTVAAAVSGGRWRTWTLTARSFARGATLELGCGPGHLQQALAAEQRFAAAVDLSPQMIRLARRRLAHNGYMPRLARANARALPFADQSFDTILATFPSDYIAAAAVAAEVRRVLRPGGRVAVALWATMDGDTLYHRAVALAYRLTLQRAPRPTTPPFAGSAAHVSNLPAGQHRIAETLQRAGLRVTHTDLPAPQSRVFYVLGVLPDDHAAEC